MTSNIDAHPSHSVSAPDLLRDYDNSDSPSPSASSSTLLSPEDARSSRSPSLRLRNSPPYDGENLNDEFSDPSETPTSSKTACTPLASPQNDNNNNIGIGVGGFVSPVSPLSEDESSFPESAGGTKNANSSQAPPKSYSLWDHLKQDIFAGDLYGTNDLKSERIANFLSVPMAVEKTIMFGFAVCLDALMYNFTILPLRLVVALYSSIFSFFNPKFRQSLAHRRDLVKGSLIILSCILLHHVTDASRMYHSVRGQETIKLYVIFNVLEIADRLCCSFGQDLLDSLLSRTTLSANFSHTSSQLRFGLLYSLTAIYTIAHTLVLFFQLVTLNVAINSYSNALLTLLLSNQFVEIKSSVFKKFEKENLFQMSCADMVERFQLAFYLTMISTRNLIEVSGSTFSSLPTSFVPVSLSPSFSLLQSTFSPAAIVFLSEIFVDWLKHAFITKFNHIRPSVYGRFIDVLCRDLLTDQMYGEEQSLVDQSPAVSRRLGFAAIPLSCLAVRVCGQALDMLLDTSHIDECAIPRATAGGGSSGVGRGGVSELLFGTVSSSFGIALAVILICVVWACFVGVKVLIGINLRAYAVARCATMSKRSGEERLNGRSRSHIGVDADETEMHTRTEEMIRKSEFDAPGKYVYVNHGGSNGGGGGEARQESIIESLSRFSMVKSRIY